jgi:RES domain-containing protein
MLPESELAAVLAALPTHARSGVSFRSVALATLLKYPDDPLSGLGASATGARFTPPKRLIGDQAFETLYLALEHETMALEVGSQVRTEAVLLPVALGPRVTLSVKFSLERVIDLTGLEVFDRLGTNPQEFFGPWKPSNIEGRLAPTQRLGWLAHQHAGIEALLVPSARTPTGFNLAVFRDRLRTGSSVTVTDPDGSLEALKQNARTRP